MKSLPRNARIRGEPFLPSRFIFGDAVDDEGLEGSEYLVHTESPAFICRLVGNDDTDFPGRESEGLASAVLYDEAEKITVYVCNLRLRLFDFNFYDEIEPNVGQLQDICDEAMRAYQKLQKAYAERDAAGPPPREMRTGPTKPLPPAERQQAISQLIEQARLAVGKPMGGMQLAAAVQMALMAGDQAVFTEAQLALLAEPDARQLLIQRARDAVAFPEVLRKDGSVVSFELWALPFAFSRSQGGVWWHFPRLEALEVALADALEVPEKSILWISPTLFTVDMLNERGCQDLVQLAPVMDAGCDFAPLDPESSRATYEAARKTNDPQLVMAWIPFLVERGALPMDKARRLARRALDVAMPLVQQAVAAEMEYGEAELFAPLPWWEALSSGMRAWNRKRLGVTAALLAASQGGIEKLEAVAEYQPEIQGFDVALRVKGRDEVEARVPWLVVPDVAPDRDAAWRDLADCLREAGMPLSQSVARLH
ncbi:hypothetical protein [Chromobacterium amazonense]|uniref:Uncharacterized protein n=1 Tax=Chromobacterium amazonense TaxID=1382803 RepID=A0ABU8V1E2_9NEIS|nr:hypothetical protein [Chromobacterium amazonense]KIA78938.1 hypothetical protein QR66_18675 [Chromobacterium piscinae]MBM2886298.1 hypothetical protein [Chromobacterium amazonense]MDE1713253.1 hypothetical protein [Chromobacterium amazonense]MDQ4542289.1 hypothetical protein [Chromobacterium amazonense]OHX15518.1 hypothetical protein BI343_18955 [Chromobacterium amazonense]